MKTLRIIGLSIASAFMLMSCEKEDLQQNTDPNSPQANSFKVRMTDNPGDYAALDVELTSVQAYNSRIGWVVLDSSVQSMNVLDYMNGAETELAYVTEADSGNYTQLKFVFDPEATLKLHDNYELGELALVGSQEVTLNMQGSNEVFVEIDETVNENKGASVLVDFNVAQSVVYNNDGTFKYKPVINQVKNQYSGVRGQITTMTDASVMLTNGSDTLSTFLSQNGEFMFKGTEEGIYSLVVDPATKELQNGAEKFTVDNIVVYEGQVTFLGEISAQGQ